MIHLHRSSSVAALLIIIAACGPDTSGSAAGDDNAAAPGAASDSILVARGLDLMYQKKDPFAAEQLFRQVLQHNPNHYGARYQLAAAVDRVGRPAEARPMWQEFLKIAQGVNDTATIRLVQARLAAPDTVGASAMMAIGMNFLYARNNPAGAADEFRKVLAVNPTHYGATYQLAVALDKSGKPQEARPLWEKMLQMATATKDQGTIDTARERLKQNP